MYSDFLISAVSCYLNLNARNRLQYRVAYMPNISISDEVFTVPLVFHPDSGRIQSILGIPEE